MIRIVKCRGCTEMFFNRRDIDSMISVLDGLDAASRGGVFYHINPIVWNFRHWLNAVKGEIDTRSSYCSALDRDRIGMIRKQWRGRPFDCEIPVWGAALNRGEFDGHREQFLVDLNKPTFDEILG